MRLKNEFTEDVKYHNLEMALCFFSVCPVPVTEDLLANAALRLQINKTLIVGGHAEQHGQELWEMFLNFGRQLSDTQDTVFQFRIPEDVNIYFINEFVVTHGIIGSGNLSYTVTVASLWDPGYSESGMGVSC